MCNVCCKSVSLQLYFVCLKLQKFTTVWTKPFACKEDCHVISQLSLFTVAPSLSSFWLVPVRMAGCPLSLEENNWFVDLVAPRLASEKKTSGNTSNNKTLLDFCVISAQHDSSKISLWCLSQSRQQNVQFHICIHLDVFDPDSSMHVWGRASHFHHFP